MSCLPEILVSVAKQLISWISRSILLLKGLIFGVLVSVLEPILWFRWKAAIFMGGDLFFTRMSSILSSSKTIARFLSGRNRSLHLGAGLGFLRRYPDTRRRWEIFAQTRCLASFARCGNPCIGRLFRRGKDLVPFASNLHRYNGTRWFLGCGDGEEGTVLSKIYEERRVIGYSPEQLFAVVEAVDLYEDFVPWCQRSRILKRNGDGSFDAELEIGFKFLVESYVSHVEMERPKYIKVASMFFKEVVSRLVSSFSDRCCRIYGPAILVLEKPYGQST